MTRQVALFAAATPETGAELWITDGTPGGTRLLKQLRPGSGGASPSDFVDLGNGKTLFVATDGGAGNGLWATDGTPAGTVPVAKLNPDGDAVPALLTGSVVHALGNGRAVFTGTDGAGRAGVWATDGTPAGTSLLLGAAVAGPFTGPTGYASLGDGRVLFSADHGASGEELWATDGTPARTVLVADLAPGAASSSPGLITPLGGGKALFVTTGGGGVHDLYATDGSGAGTALLAAGVDTALVALGGGRALFTAPDGGGGTALWLTDGTPAGTSRIVGADLRGVDGPSIALAGGKTLLLGTGADGSEGLWVTDGTASGTVRLVLPDSAPVPVTVSFAGTGSGRALVSVDDGAGRAGVWAMDGTPAGTARLGGFVGLNGEGFAALGGGRFVFAARSGAGGSVPWVTDGTAAGTRPLLDADGLAPTGFAAAAFADLPVVSVSAAGARKAEGDAGTTPFTFTLARGGDLGRALSLDYAVTGAAGADGRPATAADFAGGVLPSGAVAFAAGGATATVTVDAAGDARPDSDKLFTLALSSPDAGLAFAFGAAAASGAILNDDTGVSIQADAAEQPEGNSGVNPTPFGFTVTRVGSTSGPLDLRFNASGTGANPTPASKIVNASGTVHFAAGQTTAPLSIRVKGDTAFGPDTAFAVTLSAPSAPVTFLSQSATSTVLNDDPAPRLSIAAAEADKAEADAAADPLRFTVTRDGSGNGTVNVRYVVSGTGDHPATAADFVGGVMPSGVLTFAPFARQTDLFLTTADNAAQQPDRTFSVTLLPTPEAVIASGTASGTIRDDDAAPPPAGGGTGGPAGDGATGGTPAGTSTVSVAPIDASKAEGNAGTTPFTFVLARSGDLGAAAAVAYHVAGAGVHPAPAYEFAGGAYPSGTVAFAPGQASQVLTVQVAGNPWEDPDMAFQVSLDAVAGNAVLGTSVAAGVIRNDDVYQAAAGGGTFQDAGGNQKYAGTGGGAVRVASGVRGAGVSLAPNGDVYLLHDGQTEALHGIAAVQFIDGRLVFDPADPASQTARLYQAGLGRLPDQAGLGYWTDALRHGAALGQLAASFLGSPEFTSRFGQGLGDAEFVARLYQNVLGRAPDPSGQAYWTGLLARGTGRADVLAGISESAENRRTTAPLVQAGLWQLDPAAAQAARMYDTVLGRLPDAGGLGFWAGTLGGGSIGLQGMADRFVASPEFQAVYGALRNRDFVAAIYANTLHRPGDAGGIDYWTARLDEGASRASIVVGFSESAEHVSLTAANVLGNAPGRYGITTA